MEEKNKRNQWIFRKIFISLTLLIISFLLLFIAKQNRSFAEWYSISIYPIWVNIWGRLTTILPFSISEILLYIVSFLFLLSLIICLVRLCLKKVKLTGILWGFLTLIQFFSILFILYTLNCGINYQRTSFASKTGLYLSPYKKEDLIALCRQLTDDVNQSGLLAARDASGLAIADSQVRLDAVAAMNILSEKFTDLAGYYPLPKPFIVPRILSIQMITGIYSPFTIEANYNSEMPGYNIPFTACHELSHLKGFMQEEEANFIAYLACMSLDRPEYQYSGSLVAWVYSTNVLYRLEPDLYWELRDSLIPQARQDLTANNDFWKQFDTKVSKATSKVNDFYLKANGQPEGVKSYNLMVDLLVANMLENNSNTSSPAYSPVQSFGQTPAPRL